MWSRKFRLVGLISGVAVALLAYAAIGFVLVRFAVRASDHIDFVTPSIEAFSGLSAVVGIFVYPVCWFKTIQRTRNYSIDNTFNLIVLTYGLSCLAIGAVISLILVFFFSYWFIRWMPVMAWQTGFLAMLIALSPAEAAVPVVMGVVITIVPYVVIAIPLAFFHRWFLLTVFGPADVSAAPA